MFLRKNDPGYYLNKDPEGTFSERQHKRLLFILGLAVAVLIAMIFAISVGAVDIPFTDTVKIILNSFTGGFFGEPSEDYYTRVVQTIRAPRATLCVLTGIALGMAGAVMQGLLRNPLVSPFTLGVSTASALGAAIAIVCGTSILGSLYYQTFDVIGQSVTLDIILKTIFAFIFGLLSILIVLLLIRKTNMSRSTIILSGVIISYIFQAGLMFTKYISDDTQLRDITMWMMGGLSGTTWGTIIIVLPIVLACSIYLEKLSIDINTLSSGDDVASNLGIDVIKLRNRGLIVSTLITSTCLAFTGVIGFVGLMAPHICRMIIGNDQRFLIPAAALMGALILLISDIFSRVILRPSEIPVGIVMYVLGGLFFIWLVFGKRKEGLD